MKINCNVPSNSSASSYFYGFTSIEIGDNVTSLGDYAFYYNTALKEVKLSSNLTSIGNAAFYNCKALTKVYCITPNVPTTSTNAFTNVPLTMDTLYINHGMTASFSASSPWSSFGNIVEIEMDDKPTVKVISAGNVIVSMTIAQDDAIKETGLEWRRTDWLDEVETKTTTTEHYKNLAEGYIRSLFYGTGNIFWKVRAYYMDPSGTKYYTDWKTFDPTDVSYYEPTIHTDDDVVVNSSNSVTIKAYAMRGTDNIQTQGIYYWKNNASLAKGFVTTATPVIPADAVKMTASGQIMSITLSNLEAASCYNYVAFATTSEGETFYGETCSFTTTGTKPTGINNIPEGTTYNSNESMGLTTATIYDINGQILPTLKKGLNIIRYGNGTIKKILVK